MAFSLDPELLKKLEALGSTYKVRHEREGKQNRIVGQIVDKTTGKVWCTAEGDTEQDAVTKAIHKARENPSSKPETPAETKQRADKLEAENKRLRELHGLGDDDVTPAEPAPEDPGDNGRASEVPDDEANTDAHARQTQQSAGLASNDGDDPIAEMKPRELKQALKNRGLSVPEGNPNSNEWREKAEQTLRDSTPQI